MIKKKKLMAAAVGLGMIAQGVATAFGSQVVHAGMNRFTPLQKTNKFLRIPEHEATGIASKIRALNIDNNSMVNGIDKLISDPLMACVTAQTSLNNAYIDDVLRLCDISDENGAITARMAYMSINTTGGGTTQVTLPLLALVQPAQLAITQCRIDFTAEVSNSLNMTDSATVTDNTNTTSSSFPWIDALVGRSATTRASTLSSTSDATKVINSSKKNTYKVSVKADQIENPGMIFLQELLKTAMTSSIRTEVSVADAGQNTPQTKTEQ